MDTSDNKVYELPRVRSGRSLAPLIAQAEGYAEDYPELNSMTTDAVKEFIQNVHDYSDIWDDIDISGRIDAEKVLTDNISILDELGLHTYATIYQKPMTSATGPWNMKVIVLFISPQDVEMAKAAIQV